MRRAAAFRSRTTNVRTLRFAGPCTLAIEAMKAWTERNVSTGFLIACISTALVWTCSLAIAMLHLVALAARP